MRKQQAHMVRCFGANLRVGRMLVTVLSLTAAPGAIRGAESMETTTLRLLDRSGDQLLHRTAVPNQLLKQGEVRLVRRDKGLVVQSLLHTRHLDRVIKKISGNERQNWLQDRDGFGDMQRFVEALEAQCKEARAQAEILGEKARLLIEFIAMDQEVAVAFYRPVVVTTDKTGWALGSCTLLQVLELSPDYVRQDMELIVQDAFELKPPDALKLLRELAWVPSLRLAPGSNRL